MHLIVDIDQRNRSLFVYNVTTVECLVYSYTISELIF